MKKRGGQILMVGKEKVIPILYGMLFTIGCANIPHNKQPIEHVLKIPFSKPGDRDRPPPALPESRLIIGQKSAVTGLVPYKLQVKKVKIIFMGFLPVILMGDNSCM